METRPPVRSLLVDAIRLKNKAPSGEDGALWYDDRRNAQLVNTAGTDVASIATIRVTARGPNGQEPKAPLFQVHARSPEATEHHYGRTEIGSPVIAGAGGDWTVYNVGPGVWAISLRPTNFAYTTSSCTWRGQVEGSGVINVNLALRAGGTVRGQVLAEDTGQPIAGATVSGGGARTDRSASDRPDPGSSAGLEAVAILPAIRRIAASTPNDARDTAR